MPAVFTFIVSGSQPTIGSLLAKTHCHGKRVELSWTAPSGVTVTEYIVKRSRRAFALFVDDDVQTIYTGTNVSVSDTGLEENTAYYYTIFYTDDGVNYYVGDSARVIGLSIKDYRAREGDHWFYDLLPQGVRNHDSAEGDNQYTLRNYCDVLQCGIQRLRGLTEALVHLPDWDRIVAGRVGEPVNQYGIMEAVLNDMGHPPPRALGLEAMRRVALGLTSIRKGKGTCVGVLEYVERLTRWTGTCVDNSIGECGGGIFFRTWDGFSSKVTGESSSVADGGDIDNTAGQLTDGGASLTVSLFKKGIAIDGLGNIACIEDNTATVVTFEDAGDQLQFEQVFTTVPAGTTPTIDGTLVGYRKFNDHMFKGLKLKDSAGTVVTITDNTATAADGSTTQLTLSGAIVAGVVSIAVDFLNEPQTYANREPEMHYSLYHGEHYFLVNLLFDLALKGTLEDPWDILFGGAGTSKVPVPSVFDVTIWVAAGIAQTTGVSTTLDPTRLIDSTASWTVNEFQGMYVNPNRNSSQLFRVVANSATEIFIASGDMTQVANVGDSFYVLKPLDALRYDTLVKTISIFLPYKVRAFIYFQ